jgi:hypothetical protein
MNDMKNSPWPYLIVDDFLDATDFSELCKQKTDHVDRDKVFAMRGNLVFANGTVKSNSLTEQQLRKFHGTYHEKMMGYLRQLAPKKAEFYEYSDFELVVTGADCVYPIHDDLAEKLLSVVVYLSPKQNAGTLIYSTKSGEDATEVEWRQNRALIFSRIHEKTWHAYKGDGKNNRLALIYNLMTTNIKGVYKAEGNSYARYLLGRLAKSYGPKGIVRKIGKAFGQESKFMRTGKKRINLKQ